MGVFWGADAPISQPEATGYEGESIDMGGFAFTPQGIAHFVAEEDLEELFTPVFAPEGYFGG